jgi:hypothetical protein
MIRLWPSAETVAGHCGHWAPNDSQPLVELAAKEAVLNMILAAELFFQTTR